MIFGATICLLLYPVISSSADNQYIQNEPTNSEYEALNGVIPQNYPYEDALYKPVTLDEIQTLTDKQARCLNTYNEAQTALYASLWTPSSNSKRHAKLKVVCRRDAKPKLWFTQDKHQEVDFDAKIPAVSYKGGHIALIDLDGLSEGLNAELSGCNVCVEKNVANPSYVDVIMVTTEARKHKKYQSSGKFVKDEQIQPVRPEGKIRTKRATSTSKLSQNVATTNVGDSLTVTCTGSTKNITWKDSAGHEIKTTASSNPQVKETFKRQVNKSELIFREIKENHRGSYSCFITTNGKTDAQVFSLTVITPIVKPTVKLSPNSKKVDLEEGDDYEVTCSGNSPNIIWKHSAGLVIPQTPRRSSYYYMVPNYNTNKTVLYFKNATTWHSGVFICAVNRSELVESEKLTITVKPSKLTFSPDNKDSVKVKENKDYDVTCEGPLKTVTWMLNGVEISTNKKDEVFQKGTEQKGRILQRKLKFDDLQKNDGGKYVCSGILSYNGSKIERTLDLKVEVDDSLSDPKLTVDDKKYTDSTVYLTVNDTFEITCKGDTEQILWKGPPYGWSIPESNIPTTALIQAERVKKKKVALKFKKASITEEGTYTCQVTKRLISKEKNIMVKVIDPVRFISSPQSPTAREGGYVSLECKTSGHPKAMVNWYTNEINSDGKSVEKPIIDGQNGTLFKYDNDNLLINNITYKQAGKYMCKAVQDIIKGQTIQQVVEVNVEHKPYPFKNHTILERKLNTIVTMKCNMLSNPAPYYAWYQRIDSNFIIQRPPSPDPEIQINFDDPSKFGEYKCQANNIYGSGEQHFLVITMEPPRAPEVKLTSVSNKFVHFQAFATRNSSFTHYNIEYKEKDTRDWEALNVTLGETWDTKYEIPNLQEKTTYVMRVRSINELGISNPSSETTFTTSFGIRLTVSSTVILFVAMVKWFL